ncbi:MAG: hypothetical protein V1838_01225 [Patescibacteria group bacterium]
MKKRIIILALLTPLLPFTVSKEVIGREISDSLTGTNIKLAQNSNFVIEEPMPGIPGEKDNRLAIFAFPKLCTFIYYDEEYVPLGWNDNAEEKYDTSNWEIKVRHWPKIIAVL